MWVLLMLTSRISKGWAYAIRAGMVDVDAANDEEDEHNGGDESNSTSSDRPASPTSPKRKSGFSKFFSGWSEKYTRARQQGQKVQNKFALYSQRAEKIVLLLDWSTPVRRTPIFIHGEQPFPRSLLHALCWHHAHFESNETVTFFFPPFLFCLFLSSIFFNWNLSAV